MKRFLSYIVILVIIAAAVMGGKKLIKEKRAKEEKTPLPIAYEMNVKVMNVKNKKTTLTLPYLALTKSNDDVKISSRVSARIKQIVKSGVLVTKGEDIVRIDNKELITQLESLNLNIHSINSQLTAKRVALKNLEATHKRTEELLKVKGASKEEFDAEVTGIEAVKSAIDTLRYKIKELNANRASIKNMLSYTTIKAPVSGVVTRLANVGDIAMMGKPLISISAKSNSYLLVRLPAQTKAKAIIYNGKTYKLSPLNTTYNGLLEYLANINESLASNQTVNIDVVIFSGTGFKLPHDAILNRNGKSYILTLVANKAIPKEVKIVANGEQGVIVEGVNAKEKIIVAKQDILLKLLSGIKVRAIN